MITHKDARHMAFTRRMAIANRSNATRARLAASLVIKNDVISVGQNSYKTHPLQKRFSKHDESIFKHAEVDCIVNALRHIDPEDMTRATLYVYRVKKKDKNARDWSDGLSKPCPGCVQAINHFGIKKVVYSSNRDGIYCEMVS